MAPIVQPYNLFAQQKMAGYPSYQQVPQQNPQPQQQVIPGQVAGETVDEFAQGKFNNGQPAAATQQAKPAAVTTPLPLKPAGTVDNLSGTGFASQGNGQQQPITSTEDLAKAMGYTSPEEENRLRKASVANQRMLAVVDALRHIGNIAHTVNYAPSQQFNSPVMEERQRYLQGKALRDKANQTYISYQQQKAKQDAEQKRWEAQFKYNMDKDARDYALKKNESDARANLNEAKIHRYNTLMELDQARREGIISDNEWRAQRAKLYPQLTQSQIARNNRTGGGRSGGSSGKGNTYWDYDEEGKIHYYPNKTMWEQGVESHTRAQKQQEEFKTIDGYGDQKVTYKKRTTVSKAGENAHNAANKKAPSKKKANPMGSASTSTSGKQKKKNPMS